MEVLYIGPPFKKKFVSGPAAGWVFSCRLGTFFYAFFLASPPPPPITLISYPKKRIKIFFLAAARLSTISTRWTGNKRFLRVALYIFIAYDYTNVTVNGIRMCCVSKSIGLRVCSVAPQLMVMGKVHIPSSSHRFHYLSQSFSETSSRNLCCVTNLRVRSHLETLLTFFL